MIGLSLCAVEVLVGEEPIATIAKNGKEEIQISTVVRDGRPIVVVRVWVRTPSGAVPSKYGFNLAADRLDELILGLRSARRAIAAGGE